jgi:hypothetical protein
MHALGSKLLQQRSGLFEIGGLEAFGKPVVYFGEHGARFVRAARIA